MRPLALALAAVVAASAAETPAPFRCSAPKGWTASEEDGRTVYLGPKDKNGVAAQIEVRWVAPGDASRPDADAYLERLTKPGIVEVPGWKTGKPEAVKVAGRGARRVVLETSRFVPPNSRRSVEVPMREEHVVVPAAKGYFVLVYDAPASLAAKNAPAFKAVLKAFKPSF